MQKFFTSDLHIGHKTIYQYRDIFNSQKEHDDYMINKILALGKRDILYVLGDFIFDCDDCDEIIERLKHKKCRIIVIMGNHDSLRLHNEDIFEIYRPLVSHKGCWLSHMPIHPNEFRYRKLSVHGHLHDRKVMDIHDDEQEDIRYFNVNIDCNLYEFVPVERINFRKDYIDENM